jgi:hypothetical protein
VLAQEEVRIRDFHSLFGNFFDVTRIAGKATTEEIKRRVPETDHFIQEAAL